MRKSGDEKEMKKKVYMGVPYLHQQNVKNREKLFKFFFNSFKLFGSLMR